jgi:hypothetical protein
VEKVAEAGPSRTVSSSYVPREFLTVDKVGDDAVDNWALRTGDEVRVIEGDHVGLYALVIESNGIEALVEFPDSSRAVVGVAALVLVLRPAPGTNRTRTAQIIREAFDS